MIGKRIRRVVYLKREIKDYLATRSKFLVQGYTQRVDWPTEKMGMPFWPPGVEEARRETGYDPVVQGKRRKVSPQLKDFGSFQHVADIFSRLQDVLKEQAGGKLAEAELTGHKRRVVELVGRRIARGRGAFDHFATTMTKFGWKNTGLDEGIEDSSRCLV